MARYGPKAQDMIKKEVHDYESTHDLTVGVSSASRRPAKAGQASAVELTLAVLSSEV